MCERENSKLLHAAYREVESVAICVCVCVSYTLYSMLTPRSSDSHATHMHVLVANMYACAWTKSTFIKFIQVNKVLRYRIAWSSSTSNNNKVFHYHETYINTSYYTLICTNEGEKRPTCMATCVYRADEKHQKEHENRVRWGKHGCRRFLAGQHPSCSKPPTPFWSVPFVSVIVM